MFSNTYIRYKEATNIYMYSICVTFLFDFLSGLTKTRLFFQRTNLMAKARRIEGTRLLLSHGTGDGKQNKGRGGIFDRIKLEVRIRGE